MKRMSLFDQMFYKLETGGIPPFYMCGATIVDPSNSPYPTDSRVLADHLAARLEQIPLLRKKVVQDKLKIGDIRLIDDPGFKAENHITRVTLPAPGGYAELTEYMAEFVVRRMDLSQPLWRIEVVDGLEHGRIAIATQLHHSMFDGVAAQKVMSSIWTDKPQAPEQPEGKNWQVEKEPTPFVLLRDALLENIERLYIKTPKVIAKGARPAVKAVFDAVKSRLQKQGVEIDEKIELPKVQKTSLNRDPMSLKRAVSYVEFPMDEIRALRKSLNCTVNDLVMVINSHALEHYFREIGEKVDFDLVSLMPMSARKPADDDSGNMVVPARVNLYNRVPDLRQRLDAITRDTAIIKQGHQTAMEDTSAIEGKEVADLFSPIILDVLVYGLVKAGLLAKAPLPFNVVVTNVPGPSEPIYLAGAEQVGCVPMAPTGDMMLTVTASSAPGVLVISYHGCGEAVKDKELFVEGARLAVEHLKKAAKKEPSATNKEPSATSKEPLARKKAPERNKAPAKGAATKSGPAKQAATKKPAAKRKATPGKAAATGKKTAAKPSSP